MKWPATCKTITQRFGNPSSRYVSGRHTGLDIGCAPASPIYAAHDGQVIRAGWMGAYGNTVEIRANSRVVTSYHHLSNIVVRPNQNVSAGSIIGHLGSTGNSTGPHLHFEVRVDNKAVDPEPYLSGASDVSQAGYEQAGFGIGDVFEFPGAVLDVFGWLTDTKNWYRIGMVLLGAILILRALMGAAQATAFGKAAVKTITSSAKKAGKKNA